MVIMNALIEPTSGHRPARQLIVLIAEQLPDNGSRRLDAGWILGLAIGQDAAVQGHEDICLDADACAYLSHLLERRQKGEPVSRLRGKRAFWSHEFYLNHATLDPRPDTEVIVSEALSFASVHLHAARPVRILDLGTGSGCILLSLLSEMPNAKGVGIDIAPLAIAQARANAAMLGMATRAEFNHTSWCDYIESSFITGLYDIITSNPPYVEKDAVLMPDVADYDPARALYAGADGLDSYRDLLPRLSMLMAPHSRAFIEIGAYQSKSVAALATRAGLSVCDIKTDLAGRDRCLILATERLFS